MFPDDRQAGGYRTPALIFLLLLTVRCSSAQSPSNNNNDNPYFASTNFNPSMAIVIVVLISAFFFLGFFSIYIRQCAGDRLAPSSVRPSTAARSRQQRGLDADVLATFPTLVYSEVKHLKIGKGSLECAVCLSEFDDDETLRLLPKCSHVFHADCIDAWLAAHVTCPVCRSNLVPDPNAPDSPLDPLPPPTQPSTDQQNPDPMPPPDHLAVEIDEGDEERKAEIENLERFVNMKRARSRARPANLLRSHSTGHSLIQPGEDLDRFTLRLPEDIRQGIVAASRMQRARSLAAFPREGSTRRGFRGEGSTGRAGRSIRLGRSDRWGSFLMRTLSLKNWGRRDGEGGSSRGGFFRQGEPSPGSVKGEGGSVKAVRFNPVITPLGGSVRGKGSSSLDESSTAALNKV